MSKCKNTWVKEKGKRIENRCKITPTNSLNIGHEIRITRTKGLANITYRRIAL